VKVGEQQAIEDLLPRLDGHRMAVVARRVEAVERPDSDVGAGLQFAVCARREIAVAG